MTEKEIYEESFIALYEKYEKYDDTTILYGITWDLWQEKQKKINELEKKNKMYQECFEKYIPTELWDEATAVISTYGSGLAKDIHDRQK